MKVGITGDAQTLLMTTAKRVGFQPYKLIEKLILEQLNALDLSTMESNSNDQCNKARTK